MEDAVIPIGHGRLYNVASTARICFSLTDLFSHGLKYTFSVFLVCVRGVGCVCVFLVGAVEGGGG